MATSAVENDHGCAFFGVIFQRRITRARKPSVCSLPMPTCDNNSNKNDMSVNIVKVPAPTSSQDQLQNRGQGNCSELVKWSSKRLVSDQNLAVEKPSMASSRHSFSHNPNNKAGRRVSDPSRSSTSSASTTSVTPRASQMSLAELNTKPVVPAASSGNIMLLAQMSSLKQPKTPPSYSAIPKSLEISHQMMMMSGTMGNILRKSSGNNEIKSRGSTDTLDPEVLKLMGNEEYKLGNFKQALALYDQAIKLDPNSASYRGNRSAALMSLGRIFEACSECKEAIRIDPSYQRAHHRLALLYIRLGYADKALYHFEHSGTLVDSLEISVAQSLVSCLGRCNEAKKGGDWSSLLRQSLCAISIGADSAPQIYALQVEALLNLHRHEEAHSAFKQAPKINVDCFSQIFGQEVGISLYSTQARVCLAAGSFEDAIKAAETAVQLDPSIKETRELLIRSRAVMVARARGNKYFNESRFLEASSSYSQGLEYEPYNSILLCNRGACRYKLGQFEKAIEDCNLALRLQPSYSKAMLRRANCNAKLERWEASIQDYEMLMRETPGNEEVGRALFEAQVQLRRQQGHDEDVKDTKFGSNQVLVSSNECFRHLITSPGMSVALFFNQSSHTALLQLIQPLCKRFPSIKFLKVEVGNLPYLVKSESVTYIPAFKIYKNGSRVKEVPGNSLELLEKSVKLYSS